MSKCILTHSTFSVCVYCSVVLRLLLSLPICRVLVLITEEVRYMEYRYNGTVHKKDFQIGSMDVHVLIHPQHTPPSHTTLHYTA